MKVYCPQCKSEYTVEEKFVGKKVKCGKCQNKFTITKSPAAGGKPKGGKPTANQLAYAKRLNIDVPEGIAKWELSDMISKAVKAENNESSDNHEAAELAGYKAGVLVGMYLISLVKTTNTKKKKELILDELFGSTDRPVEDLDFLDLVPEGMVYSINSGLELDDLLEQIITIASIVGFEEAAEDYVENVRNMCWK